MSDGFLVINKPGGITSHDVVGKLRKVFGTRRVGHAGTLDPMATGVLVIGINNATRFLQYITEGKKRYIGTIRLGSSTVTDDREGEIVKKALPEKILEISDAQISSGLAAMVGEISQRPSSVSAIKVDGKRAYDRVREGEIVELPARTVTIDEITIQNIERTNDGIDITIDVRCSAGTYIRAIARDLGDSLGVGGHLISLHRTEVTPFHVMDSVALESATPENLIPLLAVAQRIFPVRTIDFAERNELTFGRALSPSSFSGIGVAVFDHTVCALIENKPAGAQPIAVFITQQDLRNESVEE